MFQKKGKNDCAKRKGSPSGAWRPRAHLTLSFTCPRFCPRLSLTQAQTPAQREQEEVEQKRSAQIPQKYFHVQVIVLLWHFLFFWCF